MLVLSRKLGEKIHIGDGIEITIAAVQGNRIRLGIRAPRGVPVIRGEAEPSAEAFDFEKKERLLLGGTVEVGGPS